MLANRALQAQGTSHAQLFLYREDGTFLRQLTRDDSGQMIDPIFAPDGETIVFTREAGDQKDFWSIEPKGLNLHQLSQAPEWYAVTKDSPLFTNLEQENEPGPNSDAPSDERQTVSFRSPDGLVEIALRQTGSEDDQSAMSLFRRARKPRTAHISSGGIRIWCLFVTLRQTQ